MDADEIELAVENAELVPLLAALAQYTGDFDEYLGWIQLSPIQMGATTPPQGNLTADEIAYAKALCSRGLQQIFEFEVQPAVIGKDAVDRIVDWFSAGTHVDNQSMLSNEIQSVDISDEQVGLMASAGNPSVIIVGAGLSGIAMAHKLQRAGIRYMILEKNPDVGGTWWDNVYPGCRLDTPNYAYSFSFKQKPDWPDWFSKQADILQYIRDVSSETSIYDNIEFNAEVISADFDESESHWEVVWRNQDGSISKSSAQYFVSATGQLNIPSVPAFPGADLFGGAQVHTARWPSDLDISGKKVALIGSGASGFQLGPAIANDVATLSVFQRNAPWLLPTPNYQDAVPAPHLALLRSFTEYGRWYRLWQFWLSTEGRLALIEVDESWGQKGSVSKANDQFRDELLEHLSAQYPGEPRLLEHMTPTYPPGAKRMLRDNGDWSRMLAMNTVELVADEGIESIDEHGIWTYSKDRGRVHRDFDVIVYATGFRAQDFLYPIQVSGRNGTSLHEYWDGDAKAYATMMVPNFPNMFIMLGPNSGLAANGSIIFMSECQAHYILECIQLTGEKSGDSIEVDYKSYEAFNEYMDSSNAQRAWGIPGVSTWYQNSKGRVSQNWPNSLAEYWRMTRMPNQDHLLIREQATLTTGATS